MSAADSLDRRLGTPDAVVIGLGSMLGAGIFAVLGPAARAAGGALLISLGLAAIVAFCNATSSARLAARYPSSGGTYVYGRERLGPFWGYLAGWCFVIGKTASCAAMAMTVGLYVWPQHAHIIAVAAVAVLTAVNWFGVQKSALLTRAIVTIVLVVLGLVVATSLGSNSIDSSHFSLSGTSAWGVVQAAGLMFFAFAGYARIATLGEEVRDPARTIPRAIPIALGITLVVYASVAVAALGVAGPDVLASAAAPLADVARSGGAHWLVPVVRVGAAIAALGSLLALILGVSRTMLAMARDHHLPSGLAVIDARHGVPQRAQLVVGAIVASVAAVVDLRSAIGFSSFGVLIYYAIANAAAGRLSPAEGRPPIALTTIGLLGCLGLAFALPLTSVLAGAVVAAIGAAIYALRTRAS